MSEKTKVALEKAIADHLLDGSDDKSVMLSEFVVITSAQYMNPDRPYVTGYSWACTENISHSHLMGLLAMGGEIIKDSIREEP